MERTRVNESYVRLTVQCELSNSVFSFSLFYITYSIDKVIVYILLENFIKFNHRKFHNSTVSTPF